MHLTAPIIIIVRLGLDQGVEPVNNLTIPDDDYAHGADAGPLIIGSLEVYSSKVLDISCKDTKKLCKNKAQVYFFCY